MIKIINKGKAVNITDDDNITDGKQIIELNKDVTVPARSQIEFDTKLRLNITDAIDVCVIGEYLLDGSTPLHIVCETYDCYWPKTSPIEITIHNFSDEDITIKKGEYIAFIGSFYTCSTHTDEDLKPKENKDGIEGVIYMNDDIIVVRNDYVQKADDAELQKYHFEQIINENGENYIKIIKDKE